jgi:sterol desaturase/sphingolipid hydroxylase (fatty acid hydroxylase superfamily)
MSHLPIDKSKNPESIRLFRSDFLEFFTHITPVTILGLWLPIVVLLLVYAVMTISGPGFTVHIPLGFIIGLFLWTLTEYTLHRFLFHHKPTTPSQERIFFLFHGIHHAQPQDKTRLVMPFPVSIPLAAVFFGLFYLVLAVWLRSPQWVAPLFAGFLTGYLVYDLTHYATHHFRMRAGYAKYLKRYHMQHHYKDPNTRFGVSSPVWDWVFRTQGVE